uniref:Uncharacterized protein n=1 Tax=Romanomermis culicivorax TaxID=13658 RepID=A0A915KKI7_ROMCU
MAVRYILSCLTDTKVPNFLATEKKKEIIRTIHRDYQIAMDLEAELKKKKISSAPIVRAVPPKFQVKPAPIITTDMNQGQSAGITTSLGAAQGVFAPHVLTTSQNLRMSMSGIAKTSKAPPKMLPKGAGLPP